MFKNKSIKLKTIRMIGNWNDGDIITGSSFFSSRGDGFTNIGWETNSSFSTFCERFCKAPVKYSWKPLTLLAILSDCPLKLDSISFSISFFFVSNSFISFTNESFLKRDL